jgi:hypothetical protein
MQDIHELKNMHDPIALKTEKTLTEAPEPEPEPMGVCNLSLDTFTSIPDHPKQRNVHLHARKAMRSHLKKYHPKHADVTIAVMPDYRVYKVDGHTRCYLWDTGQLTPPKFLRADLWLCWDLEQLNELYDNFDASTAAETKPEKLSGAIRYVGIDLQSGLLTRYQWVNALQQSYQLISGKINQVDNIKAVKFFKPEIELLDSINPSGNYFVSPIIGGALFTFARYGDRALDFWEAFNEDMGCKSGEKRDGVQLLHERLANERKTLLTGRANFDRGVGLCVRAYRNYQAGKHAKAILTIARKNLREDCNRIRRNKEAMMDTTQSRKPLKPKKPSLRMHHAEIE